MCLCLRDTVVWSRDRQQHTEGMKKSVEVRWRVWRKKKCLTPLFFHFLFPWTIKCCQTHLSPSLVSDTDQVVTQASQRLLWSSSYQLLPWCPPPPHTHTHTREGRMKTACQICQFKTDRMGLESFPFKSDFSFNLSRWCNVEKLIESTTDRKHNSMFFSWISLSLQLTWCNETNLSQNISLLTYLFISLQSCFLHKKKHFSLFCAEVYHNSGNFAFTRRQRLDWWTHIFVVLIY